MKTNLSGYAEVPHTADWTLHVWGEDLNSLFIQAARGMFAWMGVERGKGEPVMRRIRLQAGDPESLLVAFLSDLLFYLEDERLAFEPAEVRIEDSNLTAHLAGLPAAEQRKEIKAVTYHRLAIQQTSGRYEVTITFDV